jgi:mRNA interferase RelE/StbE
LAWRIEFDDKAKKDLAALDKTAAKRITAFLRERISTLDNPRSMGEALKGSKLGVFWKYRVGDYRIVASIEDDALCILVVRIGNRKDVYRT